MQSAEITNSFVSRPEIEVIRVGQNDRRIYFVDELLRCNPLDRALRAHRHEDRRRNRSVVGMDQSRSGSGNGALCLDFKPHGAPASVRSAIYVLLCVGGSSCAIQVIPCALLITGEQETGHTCFYFNLQHEDAWVSRASGTILRLELHPAATETPVSKPDRMITAD